MQKVIIKLRINLAILPEWLQYMVTERYQAGKNARDKE